MPKSTFKPVNNPQKISSYCQRQWKLLLVVIICGIGFDGAMPYAAVLQGRLIDTIVTNQDLPVVWAAMAVFLGAVAVIQVMRYGKRYSVRLFANKTMMDMRLMLFNNLMNKKMTELDLESTGDLMVKAVSDVDICVEGMRKVTTEIFDTGVLMCSYVVTMLLYDVQLTLWAVAFIPVALFLAEYLKGLIVQYTKAARLQTSLVADLTYTNIEQITLQRINGLEEKRHSQYGEELEQLEKKSVKAGLLEGSMQPLYNTIAVLGIVAVLYLGGKNVLNGSWSIGDFSAYIVIFMALSGKAGKAAKLFNSYQKAKVSWARIKPYFTPYHQQQISAEVLPKTTKLVVEHLQLTYPNSQELLLGDLCFQGAEGQIIGVTGPVACGKSSLGKVLSGCYPYQGSICLDGVELQKYSPQDLSRRIAVMFHEPQLLADTIYQNITLGDKGDINAVLQQVCLDVDLQSMPLGINTVVGSSGIRLSGGQQARIALARALYHHAKLIVLDDPFAAVDLETEEKIIRNLRTNYSHSLIILISHRLAVFPLVDQIIFLQGDTGYQQGTHQQLLSSSTAYNNLYSLQQGGQRNKNAQRFSGEQRKGGEPNEG